jgi:hypothetical protein
MMARQRPAAGDFAGNNFMRDSHLPGPVHQEKSSALLPSSSPVQGPVTPWRFVVDIGWHYYCTVSFGVKILY